MTPRLRTILIAVPTGLVGLALLAMFAWWLLVPPLISASLPSWVNDGQDAVVLDDVSVSSLTLTGAVLHDLRATVPGVGKVAVDRAEVRYTVAGLLNGEVGRIMVYGLALDVAPEAVEKVEQTEEGADEALNLALPPLGPLTISDGLVRFTRNGRSFAIPFGLEAEISDDRVRAEVRVRATPPGGALSADLRLDTLVRSVDFDLGADNVSLLQAASLFFPEHSGLTGTGLLSATLSGSLDLATMLPVIDTAQATVLSPVVLDGARAVGSGDKLEIVVTQTGKGVFSFKLFPAHLATDMGEGVVRASGSVTLGNMLNDHRTTFKGEYGFSGNATMPGLAAAITSDGRVDGYRDEWGWSLKGGGPTTLEPILDAGALSVTGGQLEFEGSAGAGTTEAAATFTAKGAVYTLDKLRGVAGRCSLSARLSAKNDAPLSGPLTCSVNRLGLTDAGYSLGSGPLSFSGTLALGDTTNISGILKGRSGWLTAGATKVSGISLSLPVAWPHRVARWGGLKVGGLEYDGRNLGAASFKVRQNGDGLDFDGAWDTPILPGLKAVVSGAFHPMETPMVTATLDSGEYLLPQSFDPGTLDPALAGLTISGLVTAKAEIKAGGCGFSGHAALGLKDGFVADPENDLHVAGLALALDLEELADLRSAPLQTVTFDRLDFKGVGATKGEIEFQLTPGGAVLVEGVRFDWADGEVQTLPFTLVPGREDYDLTLYCSDLSIADLLEQLGFSDAEGQGRVSGKVPVSLKGGRIYFDAAKLQSAPDAGGTIKIRQAETLLAGVPKDSPQYIQMKIASEALKNFEYKWAVIRAFTEGDALKVQLQLDGKPADALPFEYRQDIGQLIEVTADSKGVKFQGIRLDVNFNLPMNRILDLKRLLELMQ